MSSEHGLDIVRANANPWDFVRRYPDRAKKMGMGRRYDRMAAQGRPSSPHPSGVWVPNPWSVHLHDVHGELLGVGLFDLVLGSNISVEMVMRRSDRRSEWAIIKDSAGQDVGTFRCRSNFLDRSNVTVELGEIKVSIGGVGMRGPGGGAFQVDGDCVIMELEPS